MSSVTRRSVLATTAAAAVVVVAGASGAAAGWLSPRHHRALPKPVRPVPKRAPLLEAAAVREAALITSLDATAAAHPALASRIAVLRADHMAHLTSVHGLLAEAGVTVPAAAALPSGSAVTSGSTVAPSSAAAPSTAVPVPLPSLAAVAAAEKASATAFERDSLASTGTAAVLFASISACDSTHVVWLS